MCIQDDHITVFYIGSSIHSTLRITQHNRYGSYVSTVISLTKLNYLVDASNTHFFPLLSLFLLNMHVVYVRLYFLNKMGYNNIHVYIFVVYTQYHPFLQLIQYIYLINKRNANAQGICYTLVIMFYLTNENIA